MNEQYDEVRSRRIYDEQRAEITRLQHWERQHREHTNRLERELREVKETLFAAQQDLLTRGQELLKYQWESDQCRIYVLNMHEREAAIRQNWHSLTQDEMLKHEDVPFLLWLIDTIRIEHAEEKELHAYQHANVEAVNQDIIDNFQAQHNTLLHGLDIAVAMCEHADPKSWDDGVTDSNGQGDQGRYRAQETITNLRCLVRELSTTSR